MGRWLDAKGARPRMRVSYGLFRDNPQITAPELLRYDACIPLAVGVDEDEKAGIRRQVLRGSAYAVYTHVGAIEETGKLFSDLHRKEIPGRGLTIEEDRPFLAVYLTDPTVTREKHRRTELCVPVLPIRMPLASNDGESLIAPEVLLAIA
jgi:AraC family transcriptional regulator